MFSSTYRLGSARLLPSRLLMNPFTPFAGMISLPFGVDPRAQLLAGTLFSVILLPWHVHSEDHRVLPRWRHRLHPLRLIVRRPLVFQCRDVVGVDAEVDVAATPEVLLLSKPSLALAA